MAQDRGSADQDVVAAGLDHGLRILRAHDLAGGAEAHVATWKLGEIAHQRPALKLLLLRLLGVVPQRHVEIVDLALAQDFGRNVTDLGKLQAEAFWRQAQSDLEIGAALRADAVDDLEDDAGAILEAAAVAVVAAVGLAR